MCFVCDQKVGRRRFLQLGAGIAAALAVGGSALAAGGPVTSLTGDQALAKLKEGNQRYVSSPQACISDLASARAGVTQHQAPWATILSCAYSRVPPELIFGGQNVG